MHIIGVIHTDVKPSNIMLRSSSTRVVQTGRDDYANVGKVRYCAVCGTVLTLPQRKLVSLALVLVDFADSVSSAASCYAMVGTNAYRAPEVTLGEWVRVNRVN